MECEHARCENEAQWEIIQRDRRGKLVPKKKHFCSFCMMRIINRMGYRQAVIKKIEEGKEVVNGDAVGREAKTKDAVGKGLPEAQSAKSH